LQNQRNRSPQAGRASLSGPYARGFAEQHSFAKFGGDQRLNPSPLRRDFSNYDDLFRRETGHQHAHPLA
jgi:hypothetical protein